MKPDLSEARRLLDAGMHLVKLHHLEKRPIGESWNHPDKCAKRIEDDATGYGLPLEVNGLASIDPDNVELARVGLEALGIDLEAVMQAGARTVSTRKNSGGRSIFASEGDLSWITFNAGHLGTVLELRANSTNLQDCVAGVVYLDKQGNLCTQRYANTIRPDDRVPLPDNLYKLWQACSNDLDALNEAKATFNQAIEKYLGEAITTHKAISTRRGDTRLAYPSRLRIEFNKRHRVESILQRHGYTQDKRTGRYAPSSATGTPCVRPIPGKDDLWQSDHASDPLCGTFDAWVAYVQLDHLSDLAAAEQAFGAQMEPEPPNIETPPIEAYTDDFGQEVGDPGDGDQQGPGDVGANKSAVLGELLAMKTTDEIMQKVSDAKFAWKRLIVQGHVCAVVAKPNGGKTTILTHAAGQMVAAGYQVLYVNVDASAADLKHYHDHAEQHGYSLIAPDLIEGRSADDVVKMLRKLADSSDDLSSLVMILDTLKKFVDVIQKSHSRAFFSLLRKLSAKGMTSVVLGHTNKYDDVDGKPVYEGTGDLKSDIDELIYLIPVKGEDGSITVSTLFDKQRAPVENATFIISPNRGVAEAGGYVDTVEQHKALRQFEDDSAVISFIHENIAADCKTLTQLQEISKDTKAGFSRKRLQDVLERYCGEGSTLRQWDKASTMTTGFTYFPLKNCHGVKT